MKNTERFQGWLEWLVMADDIRHIADQLREIQP